MTDDTQHNLNESTDKIRLSLKLTRGNGTRDQDAHTMKIRAGSPSEAASRADRTIAELEQRDVFDRARSVQPTSEGDDE